jgi:hypothetical protein
MTAAKTVSCQVLITHVFLSCGVLYMPQGHRRYPDSGQWRHAFISGERLALSAPVHNIHLSAPHRCRAHIKMKPDRILDPVSFFYFFDNCKAFSFP